MTCTLTCGMWPLKKNRLKICAFEHLPVNPRLGKLFTAVWLCIVMLTWADRDFGMVNLVYFFRQGGVYASWFRYSFPRPSVSWIRARFTLSASPVCSELFSMSRAYCHCHFLLICSNKVSSSIQDEINLINVIVFWSLLPWAHPQA